MAGTTPKRQRLSEGDTSKGLFSCQLCQKSYERADHLNRHLDSHRNERTFRCSECPRGFNRRDLLLRHQATHSKEAPNGRSGRASERAIKACDSCVLSKLKCDNERPCQRCRKRQVECTTDSLDQNRISDGSVTSNHQFPTPPEQPPDQMHMANENMSCNDPIMPLQPAISSTDAYMDSWQYPDFGVNGFEFPSFFEHIMVPGSDYVSAESTQIPPDISNMMPDNHWFSETDLFGLDFTPTIDQAVEGITYGFPDITVPENEPSQASDTASATENARSRHTIFERSPWLWKPETNQNAFSEENNLPLDERSLDMASSPNQPFLPSLAMQDRLSPQTRDTLFQLVIKTAKSQLTVPSFPSSKCLETLLKVGIAKRAETDAWIHPYTFCAETTRPELLTALIAAGCVCFGIPSVSKTGLVLFEIARVALDRLIEDDNSVIRDLQYLQASMMWIDICAFCGFKRKMEIAESNLQPLVTALRRFGKFDRVAYKSIIPAPDDEGDTLEAKWRQWVEEESFKRLVHHVFEHDIYTTIAKVRNPLVSYAEMTLPLPASRELWLAPTAETWKRVYLGKSRSPSKRSLSARDLLADIELVKRLPDHVDGTSAKTLHLYGVAALTWEHYQQTLLLNSPLASADPSGKLWLQSRQQKLYENLQSARSTLHDCSAVTRIFHEFLMMTLHVDADCITRFAGKCGEAEAHCAYQELQSWIHTKQARLAVWHAAQTLRAGRNVAPYQLRGQDALILYHAAMILWTFGMLIRDAARRTGTATPTNANDKNGAELASSVSAPDEQVVVLDGESNAATETFIFTNSGRPCLQLEASSFSLDLQQPPQQPKLCDLRNPQSIMAVGVKVLEGNYPNEARDKLPQLIKSLSDLMTELGALR